MHQRIVFPTNEHHGLLSKRDAHFGRANFYTVVKIGADGTIEDVAVVKNEGHKESGCGGAVENICALGADALIVSGIGGSPLKGFAQKGLSVYYDNTSFNVQQSLLAFLDKQLPKMQPEMSCSHH
ncbi:Dinitrogenase iron-molybdenum cofactor biosynthesis protein [Sulfuricurvum kujiense DSM 16994]|uniref:Dinitrogenase iron-molybdenum cofactor biosynthesis protein n=1 Tax=Sulfuricurvum kujiense (strain ATCC BAA-921 / DSM 16994 / JCM 11577 / YK-1) TaxID=709032 RepID=E4U2I6_SULKY|nr:NifB/NifX family molybdenum-iron cluster-binding protein [Sulfuricurvum kujiense]ADR34673.1 Dinitrogenase iron-molybdenum cofactor biosynthesis protein [Sulfuricurvum kujiense DSM 16994]